MQPPKRKNKKSKRPNIYNHTKTLKKPKPRFKSTKEYDFLTYIRVVFRWATENHDLQRGEIELLLYLYPKGTFIKNDFYNYHKVWKIFQVKTWSKFVKDGWVKVWRVGKKGELPLYCLTHKANILCSKMHKFCVGDLNVPTHPRSNNLAKSEMTIDYHFMRYIKEMNKLRDDKIKSGKELIIEVEEEEYEDDIETIEGEEELD